MEKLVLMEEVFLFFPLTLQKENDSRGTEARACDIRYGPMSVSNQLPGSSSQEEGDAPVLSM